LLLHDALAAGPVEQASDGGSVMPRAGVPMTASEGRFSDHDCGFVVRVRAPSLMP
jgi:hypothetical protein